MVMSVHAHKQYNVQARCVVLTISDTREVATDKSGDLIVRYLEEQRHEIVRKEIVLDEEEEILGAVSRACKEEEIDAIFTTGGTGLAARDVTIETVSPLLDKEITGFGELFRMLSYTEDIGAAAIMSRAIAGISNNTALFSMPGSSGAVRLAMEKLILPELAHVIREIRKDL